MLTTVELCAGIGGFSSEHTQALAYIEIDPQCRAVLRRHYPDAFILDDVRTCGAHNLPHCDIVKFGFPCQDLSVAGKRAGLAGARSGLFYECTRIADELRPDILVWENVPGLLSSRSGRDFLAVLVELERIGYCGAWTTLDAQWFGVAQRRQRVFGVFARRDLGSECCAEILSLAAREPGHSAASTAARADIAATIRAGAHRDGVNSPGRRGDDDLNIVMAPAFGRNRGLGQENEANILVAQFDGQSANGIQPIERVGDANTLDGDGRDGVVIASTRQCSARRLTPRECERLQGFPDDYTAWGIDEHDERVELSDSARYRMLGNAVNRKVSAWIDSRIVEVLR